MNALEMVHEKNPSTHEFENSNFCPTNLLVDVNNDAGLSNFPGDKRVLF